MRNSSKRFVYVITGWQERPASPDRPAVWRFSLEDTHAGERRGFGNLEALVAFLRANAMNKPPAADQED